MPYQIEVHHKNINRDGDKVDFVHAADVFVDFPVADVDEALEYAYRWTQNIEGSWSRDKILEDGSENLDWCEDVTSVQPLHEIDGKTYGLQSTSMGDRLVVRSSDNPADVKTYRVAMFGFNEI